MYKIKEKKMKLLELKRLNITKKGLLYFAFLMILSTSVHAQTKVGETCETKLQNAQKQLNQEKSAKQAALESKKELEADLQKLQHDYDVMEEELIDLNATLHETETLLKNALLTIEAQGSEDEKKLIEKYEAQLKTVSAEKLKVQNDLKKVQQDLNDAEMKYLKLATATTNVQSLFPFFVTDIEFKNTNKKGKTMGNYDERLMKSKMHWLTPKIYYTGLVDESKDVIVRIKVFMPDGSLWKDANVSTTFSTGALEIRIDSGERSRVLNEWTGKNGRSIFPPGKFKAGKYRMEIWYKDVCLGAKTFDIY